MTSCPLVIYHGIHQLLVVQVAFRCRSYVLSGEQNNHIDSSILLPLWCRVFHHLIHIQGRPLFLCCISTSHSLAQSRSLGRCNFRHFLQHTPSMQWMLSVKSPAGHLLLLNEYGSLFHAFKRGWSVAERQRGPTELAR